MRNASLLLLPMFLFACAATDSDTTADEDGDDPGTTESAWEAQSVTNEATSTHLWVVNHGVSIIGKHQDDPIAKGMSAIMNDAVCRKNWQQGLFDADFKKEYNNGRVDLQPGAGDVHVGVSGATWESHFYDPDTGKNYKGDTSPTAYTESTKHYAAAKAKLAAKDATACYNLGLALHYYTDLTQPMHAVNFTALSRPLKLHSNLEHYAMEVQERFPLADWSGPPAGDLTMEKYVVQTAKDAKPLFQQGVAAIHKAYKEYVGWHYFTCRNVEAETSNFFTRQRIDYEYCWEGHPAIDEAVGGSLKSAQDHTAKFLYLVGKEILAAAAPAPTDNNDD